MQGPIMGQQMEMNSKIFKFDVEIKHNIEKKIFYGIVVGEKTVISFEGDDNKKVISSFREAISYYKECFVETKKRSESDIPLLIENSFDAIVSDVLSRMVEILTIKKEKSTIKNSILFFTASGAIIENQINSLIEGEEKKSRRL